MPSGAQRPASSGAQRPQSSVAQRYIPPHERQQRQQRQLGLEGSEFAVGGETTSSRPSSRAAVRPQQQGPEYGIRPRTAAAARTNSNHQIPAPEKARHMLEPSVGSVFGAVWCVNLLRRPDRLEEMRARFIKAWGSVPWRTFEAVDGEAVVRSGGEERDFQGLWECSRNAAFDRHVKPGHRYATPGELGCALSHAQLWRKVAREEDSWSLIVEDDVLFSRQFARQFATLWPRVPSGAQLVYLGFSDRGNRGWVEGTNSSVFRPEYGFETHCYAITREAASVLLDHLPVVGPVDVWLADNKWFGLRVYCILSPGGGWQNTGEWLVRQDPKTKSDVKRSSREISPPIIVKKQAKPVVVVPTQNNHRGGRRAPDPVVRAVEDLFAAQTLDDDPADLTSMAPCFSPAAGRRSSEVLCRPSLSNFPPDLISDEFSQPSAFKQVFRPRSESSLRSGLSSEACTRQTAAQPLKKQLDDQWTRRRRRSP